MNKLALSFVVALSAATALSGCDLDVPDLNNPPIDDLEENPTRENVISASIGLVIGQRGNVAAANGYVSQLGILGRESYNFDNADPRYVGELLAGPLQKGSPFGGNFWAGPYANLRLATLVVNGANVAPGFSDAERAGVRGFAQTMMALDLLRVITTRDTIGAVIDVDNPIDELAPIVGKDAVYAEINRLLDAAATDLAAGGDAFPFSLPAGFRGFDDPATFRELNRAIRARVACYTSDYPTALTALNESFIDETAATLAALDVGVYYTFTTGSGDATNGLVNRNIWAHPSVITDAQMNGAVRDNRAVRKTTVVSPPGAAQGLMSDLKFTMYDATAPVPIIRNEELILLRAEAKWGTNDLMGAIADLNIVRRVSGGLTDLATTLTADEVENEILYNRRYSLLFEGGHRWIDVRRFDRIMDLPLDIPEDHVRNVRFPIPQAECDARPADEPACTIGSM